MSTLIRLGARIKAARKAAGFKTAKAFLKKHRFPASTYSQHESGSRTPDEAGLKFYAKVFDVDVGWLATGKGQPFKKVTPFKTETLAEESLELKRQGFIQEDLLAKVLRQVIKAHHIKLSAKTLQSIADLAAEVYHKRVTSTSHASLKNKR